MPQGVPVGLSLDAVFDGECMTTNDTDSDPTYRVMVPLELTRAWAGLEATDHSRIARRLRRDARWAETHPSVWPSGPAGVHRGRHRARVGDLWVLYRLSEEAHTLTLIGFGQARDRTPS